MAPLSGRRDIDGVSSGALLSGVENLLYRRNQLNCRLARPYPWCRSPSEPNSIDLYLAATDCVMRDPQLVLGIQRAHTVRQPRAVSLTQFTVLLVMAIPLNAGAERVSAAGLIVNGGFESGFANWTRMDQFGSDGTFNAQTGTTSPSNGDPVPVPPEGLTAAMSDAQGPGAHVLYQDFVVPVGFGPADIRFALFIGNRADSFITPNPTTLDFSTPVLNQQARVDLLLAGTDPFSVSPSDVLLNVYQTAPGNPLVSGYSTIVVDLTSLLAAQSGTTIRLRFAEVDNLFTFQLGVDNVDLRAVPEPKSALLVLMAFATLAGFLRSRERWTSKVSPNECVLAARPLFQK
jgi:hypothetical protein